MRNFFHPLGDSGSASLFSIFITSSKKIQIINSLEVELLLLMSSRSKFYPVECPSCHTVSAPNEQFCGKCGFNLKQIRQHKLEKQEIDQFIEKQWVTHEVTTKQAGRAALPEIPEEFLERSRLAPFHYRLVAYIIDNFFIWTAAFFFTVAIIPDGQELGYFLPIIIMIKMLFGLLYFTILLTKGRRQTVGMMLVRIELIDVYTHTPPADVRVLILSMIKSFEVFLLIDLIIGKYFSEDRKSVV